MHSYARFFAQEISSKLSEVRPCDVVAFKKLAEGCLNISLPIGTLIRFNRAGIFADAIVLTMPILDGAAQRILVIDGPWKNRVMWLPLRGWQRVIV